MIKYEVLLDNQNIVLKKYLDINSSQPKYEYINEEVYTYFEYMSEFEIKNIYASLDHNEMTIEFNNFIIELDAELLKNQYLSLLYDKVINFVKENTNNSKNVTRQNKHVGKTMIAGALVISFLVSLAIKKGKENKKHEQEENTTALNIDDNPNVHKIDDEVSTTKKYSDEYVKAEPEYITATEDNFSEYSTIEFDFDFDNNKEIKSSSEEQATENTNNNDIPIVRINYGDVPDIEKDSYVDEHYADLITKYANMYGIDSNVMIAIAKQERGIHSETIDRGGGIGLMQVQVSVWDGEELTAFNKVTNEYETIIVDAYRLSDLEYNIKVACMIFYDTSKQMLDNTLATIQCYNMGYGNMINLLQRYGYCCGKSFKEILSDPTDVGWIDFIQSEKPYILYILEFMGDNAKINSVDQEIIIEKEKQKIK